MPNKIAKSIRMFIRKEKARIRRQILYTGEQNKMIGEVYKKLKIQKNA
jgi:hypothetical protein